MGNFSKRKRRKDSHDPIFSGSRSNSRDEIDDKKRKILRQLEMGCEHEAWEALVDWEAQGANLPSPALWESVGEARVKRFIKEGRLFRAEAILDELSNVPHVSSKMLRDWGQVIRRLKKDWDQEFQDMVSKAIDLEIDGPSDDSEKLAVLDRLFVSFCYLQDPEDSVRLADESRGETSRSFSEVQYKKIDQWLDEMYYLWTALDHLGIEEEASEVAGCLKKIGSKSSFSHWKLWIQSWKAYQDNKPKDVLKRVQKLPEGSLVAKLGWALVSLFDGEIGAAGKSVLETLSTEGLELIGRLTGQSLMAESVLGSQKAWEEGAIYESYRRLKSASVKFPSYEPDVTGALSDLFFNSSFRAHGEDWKRAIEFLEEIEKDSFDSRIEKEKTLRSMALALSEEIPAFHLKICWEEFLKSRESQGEVTPSWSATAWVWLGRQLAKREALSLKDEGDEEQFWENHIGESEAEACIQRALKVQPDNLDAHLAFLELMDQKKRAKRRDAALRALLKGFPNEPRALTLAGKVFIENRGLKKGLTCLEKAKEHAPDDPAVLSGLIAAYETFARRAYAKEMQEVACEALEKGLVCAPENAESWTLSSWSSHASFAALRIWNELDLSLLETAKSKKPASLKPGLAWLKKAGDLQADSRLLEFYTRCALSYYSADRGATEDETQAVKLWTLGKGLTGRAPKLEALDLLPLVEVWKFWKSRHIGMPKAFSQETEILEKLFQSVKKFPKNLSDLRPLVDATLQDPELRSMALPLVRSALKTDADSLPLQLMDWMLDNGAPQFQSIEKLKEWKEFVPQTRKLMELGNLASETGETECATEISHLAHNLRQVWQYEVAGTPGGPASSDVWDPPRKTPGDPAESESPARDSMSALKSSLSIAPRNVVTDASFFGDPVLTEILEDLAGLSDQEFERLSRSRPVDVPEHVFHQILEMSEKLRQKQKESGDLF